MFTHTSFFPPARALPGALLGLLLLTGCINYGEINNKPPAGRILEVGTLKPIAGARVTMYGCSGVPLGTLNCTRLDSTLSDAEGRYAMRQTADVPQVAVRKAGYFSTTDAEGAVQYGSEDKADVLLAPHAWLKVLLKNESGAYLITAPAENATGNGRGFRIARGEKALIKIFDKGNQDFKYSFGVYKEPSSTSSVEDFNAIQILNSKGEKISLSLENSTGTWFRVYLPGHDTTTITITY